MDSDRARAQSCAHLAACNSACSDHVVAKCTHLLSPARCSLLWICLLVGQAAAAPRLLALPKGSAHRRVWPRAHQRGRVLQYTGQCVAWDLAPLGGPARAASAMRWVSGYAHRRVHTLGLGATPTGRHNAEHRGRLSTGGHAFPLDRAAAKSTCLSLRACPRTCVCSPMCRTALTSEMLLSTGLPLLCACCCSDPSMRQIRSAPPEPCLDRRGLRVAKGKHAAGVGSSLCPSAAPLLHSEGQTAAGSAPQSA